MGRVEETFAALMPVLESHEIERWNASQVELLCSMLKEYGLQARTAANKNLPHHSSDATYSAKEEGEGEEDEEEMDEEALFVVAVSEVDRGLGLTREFLKSRLPYGAQPEPTQIPGSHVSNATTETIETDSMSPLSKKRARSPGAPQHQTAAGAEPLVPVPVYAVDSFLYSEDDIEEMVQSKKIAREYCTRCGCTEVGLVDFITHSFSRDQLIYLSCFLFPHVLRQYIVASNERNTISKTEKKRKARGTRPLSVVDVGSRLGVVLWACAYALQQGALVLPPSNCDGSSEEDEDPELHITGVEMDAAYIKLSHDVLRRFFTPRRRRAPKLDRSGNASVGAIGEEGTEEGVVDISSKLHLVFSNCFEGDGAAALTQASVVVLHNVFEYFCPSQVAHAQCWIKLQRLVCCRGQFLVCSPAMEETLGGFTAEVWAAAWAQEQAAPVVVPPLQWLSSFVERVDVSSVAENFLTMRSLSRGDHGCSHTEGCRDECCEGVHRHDEHEGDGHSHHGHGHVHCHSHRHDERAHNASEGSEHSEDDSDADSEVVEQVQKIYVYRVL